MKRFYYRHRHKLSFVLSLGVIGVIGVFCLLPFYWILITSFKPVDTEFRLPIEYWPSKPTLENYRTVMGEGIRFQEPIKNSIIVSGSVTVASLVLSSMAAYAIARLRFKYRIQSLLAIQVGSMIPAIVTIAPTFVIIRALGLLRTLPGIILPHIVYNIPLCTFLMASYFAHLPFELEDAAKLDGYTPFRIFWRVIMPLSLPGLFSTGILAFLGSWGDFILAYTITMGLPKAATVPVAILTLGRQWVAQWSWISAATVLSLIPLIMLVLIFQRWVIRGLTMGAVRY